MDMDVNNYKTIYTTFKQLVEDDIKKYPIGTLFLLADRDYFFCKTEKALVMLETYSEKESSQKPKKAQTCTQCGAPLTNEYYCEYCGIKCY